MEKLDEIDNQILALLTQNARMTYSEIGTRVGLTRTGAKNRIDALERDGIIQGYHAAINPIAMPDSASFYAFLETKPEAYDVTVRKLKEEPCVRYLIELAGNNTLFILCTTDSREGRVNFRTKVNNTYEGITFFSVKDIWKVDKGAILP